MTAPDRRRTILIVLAAVALVAVVVVLFVRGDGRDRRTPTAPAVATATSAAPSERTITLANPERIHRWLTNTSEALTRRLLLRLAKERFNDPAEIRILGGRQPAADGTLRFSLRGGAPPRTLAVVVDTSEPGRLTLRVDGRRWKSVPTDAAVATPPAPSEPT
jgi:hypothetical protein